MWLQSKLESLRAYPLFEHLISSGRNWTIGGFGNDLGLNVQSIAGSDLVFEGSGHKDVALLFQKVNRVLYNFSTREGNEGFLLSNVIPESSDINTLNEKNALSASHAD